MIGDGSQVTALKYKDRATDEEHTVELAGIFVQIGLLPNTDFLKGTDVELTNRGEIVINERNETNVKGVFAAGDCTTVPTNRSSSRLVKVPKHHYLPLTISFALVSKKST